MPASNIAEDTPQQPQKQLETALQALGKSMEIDLRSI